MSCYEFEGFRLDVEQLLLLRDGEPVALGPKVVETLLALVERHGELITKTAILDRVWPDAFVEESNLAQNVHVLRRTFKGYGISDPIETIPRRGYRFVAPVSLTQPPAAATLARPARHRRFGAMAAAAALVLAVLGGTTVRDAHRFAGSAQAAQLHRIGRYYWNLRTPDGVKRSLALFRRAVDAEPGAARNYAALADANVAIGAYCYGSHEPSFYFARAAAYARQALALDPRSPEAHATLGIVALERGDAATARAELRSALARDPNYAPAETWYGLALLRAHRADDAVAHLRRANRLDPLAVATLAALGRASYERGRYADAIRYEHHALELAPNRVDALTTIGAAYEATGDYGRAVAAYHRLGSVGAYYRRSAVELAARAAEARRLGTRGVPPPVTSHDAETLYA